MGYYKKFKELYFVIVRIYLSKINLVSFGTKLLCRLVVYLKSNIPRVKLYKSIISLSIVLLFVICAYFYLYLYLSKHQKRLDDIALQDIQQAFIKYIKEDSSWQIIEIIEKKNIGLVNELEYIYDLDSRLDRMFSRHIYYELYVNDIFLISNIYNDQKPLESKSNFHLSKDIICHLSISLNPNSQYFKNIQLETGEITALAKSFFFVQVLCFLYLLITNIKDTAILQRKDKLLDQILLFLKIKKNNTTQFHNYYIKKRHKLFSLPLLGDYPDTNYIKEIVDIKSLSHDLIQYVEGYKAYIKNDANLSIDIKDADFINICFDKQIFNQVIFSITSNIMHFLKSFKGANIKLSFSQSSVNFVYNKSFPINEEILKINSDSVILGEFFEPFILGFSDIFDILKKLGATYVVKHDNALNIIEISWSSFHRNWQQSDEIFDTNVVSLSRIREERKKNDI